MFYVLYTFVAYLLTLPRIYGKEHGMDMVCSTHGRENEFIQGFGGTTRRKDTFRKT
jgi:hypothetical protein